MQSKSNENLHSYSLKAKVAVLTLCFFVFSLTLSIIGFTAPVLNLNENQVLYLFSTSNQVISAIYGLTLTGLIFFINELNREQAEDETREASTHELKGRYYSFLIFITACVLITIGLGNCVISSESIGPGVLNAALINSGQTAFVVSLLAISIFVFEVVDPQALERASGRIKESLDPVQESKEIGSLEDFMRNFNALEGILVKYGEAYQYAPSQNTQFRGQRRLSNARLAEVLLRNEKISRDLFEKLRELISLRNSIVHGADPVVSRQLVEESADTLKSLEDALELARPHN